MVTRSLWFANVDHYETYVRDVARRIREMSKLPAIDWDDEDASELDTPVVGADTSSRTDITSDNSDVAAGG